MTSFEPLLAYSIPRRLEDAEKVLLCHSKAWIRDFCSPHIVCAIDQVIERVFPCVLVDIVMDYMGWNDNKDETVCVSCRTNHGDYKPLFTAVCAICKDERSRSCALCLWECTVCLSLVCQNCLFPECLHCRRYFHLNSVSSAATKRFKCLCQAEESLLEHCRCAFCGATTCPDCKYFCPSVPLWLDLSPELVFRPNPVSSSIS